MSVGVMKDYKLKLRDLRASHTLGLGFIFSRIKKGEDQGKEKCHAKSMSKHPGRVLFFSKKIPGQTDGPPWSR
jgi:hypothetical protein